MGEFDLWDHATEIVHGGCRGVDSAANQIFESRLPVVAFPAKWDEHGRAAGPIRNAEMAAYADELLLIWDGKSRGSASMKREMEKAGKPVHEYIASVGKPATEKENS